MVHKLPQVNSVLISLMIYLYTMMYVHSFISCTHLYNVLCVGQFKAMTLCEASGLGREKFLDFVKEFYPAPPIVGYAARIAHDELRTEGTGWVTTLHKVWPPLHFCHPHGPSYSGITMPIT